MVAEAEDKIKAQEEMPTLLEADRIRNCAPKIMGLYPSAQRFTAFTQMENFLVRKFNQIYD